MGPSRDFFGTNLLTERIASQPSFFEMGCPVGTSPASALIASFVSLALDLPCEREVWQHLVRLEQGS